MKKVLLSLLLAIACMPMAIGQNKAGSLVTIDTTVCSSFTWMNGVTYNHDTVVLYAPENDSNTYVLNLTMSQPAVDTAVAIPLDGTCSVSLNGHTWTTSGTFLDTLSTVSGCDSIVKVQVTLVGETHDTITAVACDKYVFDSVEYTTSGEYTITESTGDCHQYTHLNLTINPSYTDTAAVVVRDTIGGCRIDWQGITYTFADTNRTVYGNVKTAGNCDSLVAIHIVSFNGIQNDTNHVYNCGSYTWSENRTLYTTDTIVMVTTTTATCTENKYLDLHLVDNYDTVLASSCDYYLYRFTSRSGIAGARDTAYFYESGVYTEDENGVPLYSKSFTTGCITYHTLSVNITPIDVQVNPTPVYDTVCDSYSISFNGRRYTFTESVDSLLLFQNHYNANICYDTSMWIHIVVNHKSYSDTTVRTCDSYFWPFTEQTYTSSTVQTYVLPNTRNSVNCDSVGRLNLTINYTPEVTIEGNWHLHPNTTNVANLKIVDNPADHNTYKWFKNNESTPFSTADSVAVTVDANTDIHLETTSNKGCTANNWITITYTVGIDDVDGLNVNLYPNPTSRYLNVESAEGISEVIVYNVIGQQVIRRDVNASATQLDLGVLAAGNYTLQIRTANGEQTTRKFIVNK
ncbi:MAG: T9SS type A sorting domain-containing protein [Bacteroidales bacterium]|nr:T9SS type A sorting domain-containing protein [Bacteroidales bacterium]